MLVGGGGCIMPSVKHVMSKCRGLGYCGGGKVGKLYRVKGILDMAGYPFKNPEHAT